MKTTKILVQKSETGLSEDNKAKLKSLEIYRLSLHKGTKSDMRFKSSLILFYDFFRLCLFIQLYRFASVVLYRLAINF